NNPLLQIVSLVFLFFREKPPNSVVALQGARRSGKAHVIPLRGMRFPQVLPHPANTFGPQRDMRGHDK
ncbi:hypothetical protein KCA24_34610, partial [Escherichia coli]|nr:hypothetical protein [Escherichia coli]